MSESAPKESKGKTIRFIIILCALCALILSLLATSLQKRQKEAVQLNQIKELLVASKILSPDQETFLISDGNDLFTSANFDTNIQMLVPSDHPNKPSVSDIFSIYNTRVTPLLVDTKGKILTFAEAKINYDSYLEENEKSGYANLPLKLLYRIFAEPPKHQK